MAENWIEAMIEREALPKSARLETVVEFCAKWGISEATYYYQSSKPDNWKKTLEISLMSAKKECPEILKVLGEKAKAGDTKAIDMYLNYIVQLAKNLDVKSDGQSLVVRVDNDIANKYNISEFNSSTKDNSSR